MAQFNKSANAFVNQTKSLFDVVMLADASGNVITPAASNSSSSSSGYGSRVSASRANNATAYTANDVVLGAVTFSNVGPSGGGEVIITSAALEIDVAAVPSGMTSFNLYLYNATPPSAVADNGAFDIPSGDRASLVGKVSLGTPVDEGSTLKVHTDSINQQVTVPSGGTLYGYLVTAGAFTPAGNSEVYVVTLHSAGL